MDLKEKEALMTMLFLKKYKFKINLLLSTINYFEKLLNNFLCFCIINIF